jgi:hypothetical protein
MPSSRACRCRRGCRRRGRVIEAVELVIEAFELDVLHHIEGCVDMQRRGRSCTVDLAVVEAEVVHRLDAPSQSPWGVAECDPRPPSYFPPLRRVPTSRPGASAGRFWRASKSRSTAGHRGSTSSRQPSRGGGCRGSTVMFMGERLEGACRTPAGRLRRRPAGAGRRSWRMTSSPSAARSVGAPSSLLGLCERSCRRRRGCVTHR